MTSGGEGKWWVLFGTCPVWGRHGIPKKTFLPLSKFSGLPVFLYPPVPFIAFLPLFGSVVLWWIWKNRWLGVLFAVYIRPSSSESLPYILTFMSRHSQKMIMSVFWHWGPGVTIQGVREFLLCLWSACNVVFDDTTQQYPPLFSCVCILFTQQDYVMLCMD